MAENKVIEQEEHPIPDYEGFFGLLGYDLSYVERDKKVKEFDVNKDTWIYETFEYLLLDDFTKGFYRYRRMSDIKDRQAKGLIEKLRGMASNYFNAKVSHVSNLPDLPRTSNKQAMYALDAINDAISKHRKISFIYNEMGTDLNYIQREKNCI